MSTPLTSTDPKDIANAARCFQCITPAGFSGALNTYLTVGVVNKAQPPCVTPVAPVVTSIPPRPSPNSLLVQWSQPANTGSLITTYTIKYGTTQGGPYPNSITAGAGARAATITGLSGATTYYVVIVGNSFAGCSSAQSNEGSGTTGIGLKTGLLGYWKLDEASNVNRSDATGNGFTATQSGGNVAAATGIINNGASFPAVNQGLSISSTLDTRVQTTPFSVQFWYNPTAFTAGNAYIATLNSGGIQGFLFFTANNGRIDFYSTDDAGTVDDQGFFPPLLVLNSWAHIIGTWDGTKKHVFINGSEVGTGLTITGLGISRGHQVMMIGNYSTPTAGVTGTCDEVGYWNRALSASEAVQLYNGGSGLPFGSFT